MNLSKIHDPRCWEKWRRSRAVARVISVATQTSQSIENPYQVPGVVSIAGDLYVQTPTALNMLLQKLRQIGYEIKDCRQDEDRHAPVETMEKEGWSLWFASLDVRRGKCNSCGSYISTLGIRCHGHKCELCGEVTYYKIIDGSTIRFSFIPKEDEERGFADLSMTARRWDTTEGYLYLYPELSDGLWLRGDRVRQYFEANADKWEKVTEDGVELIRVRYPERYNPAVSAISPSDIHGHHWNHKIVRVWNNQEYDEYFSKMPFAETVNVYEAWHWAPLQRSTTIHKRVLSAIHNSDDKGWHYQDGSPWFTDRSFSEMGRFIRYFTTLDADAWDRQSPRFRRDGPGGIDDVTAFCHPKARAENRPNIGNLLAVVGKISSGRGDISEDEVTAAADAFRDPRERQLFDNLMSGGRIKRRK